MGANCCRNACTERDEDLSKNEGDDSRKYVTTEELVESLARSTSTDSQNPEGVVENRISLHYLKHLLKEDTKGNSTFVTKCQVESACKRGSVTFPAEVVQASTDEANRAQGRKGTGFVTKKHLLEILKDVDTDDEEDGETLLNKSKEKAPNAKPPTGTIAGASTAVDIVQRCKDRKGTGFVTKKALKKVLIAAGETDP